MKDLIEGEVQQTDIEPTIRISPDISGKHVFSQAGNQRDSKSKPSPRLRLAIGMICLSYITCWPVITLLAVIAVRFKEPMIFSIGSPSAYAFSHLLLVVGIFTAGSEGLDYSKALFRRLVGFIGSLVRSLIVSDAKRS
jgi:hypothetical protein